MYVILDFCPPGDSCRLELTDDGNEIISIPHKCPYHASLGLTDTGLFEVILQSSRVKETARYAAKLELALDKEHPGLPYTVDALGNFSIQSGVTGKTKTSVRNAVAAAVANVYKPAKTSTVTVG